jgi:hypothetical protein
VPLQVASLAAPEPATQVLIVAPPEQISRPVVAHTPGARLYKTGDMARYRADGEIEFLGRADHQVKVRGVRIELEEIEALLAEHPGIRQSVVALHTDEAGTEQLVAYCVADPGVMPGEDELRAWLHKRLPDYMAPSTYMFLPTLPLTPNGKADRAALPAPDPAQRRRPFVQPRDRVEGLLAEIWSEVLHLDRVGAHDNFFDLGGHSLLLAKVRNQLQRRLGRTVPILDLFTYPTVASLADHLGHDGHESTRLNHTRDTALRQRQALARRAATRRSTGTDG